MSKPRLVALLALALFCGCTASSGLVTSQPRVPAGGSIATITVDNRHLADVSVYAIFGETRVRLGAVQALSNRTFAIPRVIPLPSDVGVYATARADDDVYASLPIAVRPGDAILCVLENTMKFSMLLKR